MTNPFMIPQPFANNGNKNDIKDVRDPIDPIQTAAWLTGFPPVTMTPKEAGGLPPNGLDMNGVLNAVSQGLVHRQRGERMQFSFAYATSIGGYPKGAIIQSNDMTKEFQSLVDNNATDPNTTLGAFWKIYAGDGSVADGSQTQKGLVQFATAQQVQDKLDIARAINPADVVKMFTRASNKITFPDGTIILWGATDFIGGDNMLLTSNFHEPFPNECYFVQIGTKTQRTTGLGAQRMAQYVSHTKSQFSWFSDQFIDSGPALISATYIAIGY